MLFVCRDCGNKSPDIDMILDGSCNCGGTHFKMVSDDSSESPPVLSTKEELRRNLHQWLDLNIDSIEDRAMENVRVSFECPLDDR